MQWKKHADKSKALINEKKYSCLFTMDKGPFLCKHFGLEYLLTSSMFSSSDSTAFCSFRGSCSVHIFLPDGDVTPRAQSASASPTAKWISISFVCKIDKHKSNMLYGIIYKSMRMIKEWKVIYLKGCHLFLSRYLSSIFVGETIGNCTSVTNMHICFASWKYLVMLMKYQEYKYLPFTDICGWISVDKVVASGWACLWGVKKTLDGIYTKLIINPETKPRKCHQNWNLTM